MGNLAELFISFILASGQWAGPTWQGSALDANASIQEPSPPAAKAFGLSPGDRVRFSTAAGQSVTEAEVLASDPGALLLKVRGVAAPVRIPWPSLRRLEVHRGQESLARKGGPIGALSLGIPFAVRTIRSAGGADLSDGELVGVAVAVGTVGAWIGGLAGTLTGSSLRTDRWDKVNLHQIQIGVTPQRGGGVAANLSLRF